MLKHLKLSGLPELYSISDWAGPAPKQMWSFQCLQRLKVARCYELKCVFSMETPRSLPELMELCIYNCQELEQIVAANEELVQLPNAELYFPKLKKIEVENCNKLKSLFPISMVTMLPQLSTLHLKYSIQLQEVFRHSQSHNIMNKMEIILPNLNVIRLDSLPNFVDICRGCKLHADKLQELNIYSCPNAAPSLKEILVAFLPSPIAAPSLEEIQVIFLPCPNAAPSLKETFTMFPFIILTFFLIF
jgi:hypothetical protein